MSRFITSALLLFCFLSVSLLSAQTFYLTGQSVNLIQNAGTSYYQPEMISDDKALLAATRLDFGNRLLIWRTMPTSDNVNPDYVNPLRGEVIEMGLYKDTVLMAYKDGIEHFPLDYIKTHAPLNTFPNGIRFSGMGNIVFNNLTGTTWDDTYFYVAQNDSIHVWRGMPANPTISPVFSIKIAEAGTLGKINSNGSQLVVCLPISRKVLIYDVASLSAMARPLKTFAATEGVFNKPSDALIRNNQIFISDIERNCILAWENFNDMGDTSKLILLGKTSLKDTLPLPSSNSIMYPTNIFYTGKSLWVGESRASSRMVRFRNPSSACDKPDDPVLFGNSVCPGIRYTSDASLFWTSSAESYQVFVEKYPFGSANLVYKDTCRPKSASPIFVNDFVRYGGVYRWYVKANGGKCGESQCFSDGNNAKYFYTVPKIKAVENPIICADDEFIAMEVDAVDVGEGANVIYEWYKDNVLIADVNKPTYQAKDKGTYKVRVKITGSATCNAINLESSNTVMVQRLSIDNFKILKNGTESTDTILHACVGEQLFFTAEGATNFRWEGSGTEALLGSSMRITPQMSGLLTYAVIGTVGSCSRIKTFKIQVRETGFKLELISKPNTCLGDSVKIKATGGSGIFVWLSDIPFAMPTRDSIRTYRANSKGEMSISVDAVDQGCHVIKALKIIVLDTPSTYIAPLKLNYCKGDTIGFLTFNSSNRYEWSGPNIVVQNNAEMKAFTSNIGTYRYNYTVTDINGCRSRDAKSATIYDYPIIRASADKDSACLDTYVNLRGTGADAYVWKNVNKQSLLPTENLSALVNRVGIHKYYLEGTTNGCTSLDSVSFVGVPYVTPSVSLKLKTCSVPELTIVAKATNLGRNPVYNWYENGVRLVVPNDSVLVVKNPIQGREYLVAVTPDSTVCVKEPVYLSGKMVISTCDQTSVEAAIQGMTHFSLYPNPNTGIFNIELALEQAADIDFTVRNAFGQVVLRIPAYKTQMINKTIELPLMAKGLYMLETRVNEGKKISKFIVF